MTQRLVGRLALVYAVPALLAAVVVAIALSQGVESRQVLDDPNYFADQPYWTGVLSQVGALTWAAGGGIALLGWAVCRTPGLLGLGLLTAYLALDDALQVHDGALLAVENAALLVLGLVGAAVLWQARALVLGPARPWFFSGAALLGLSVVIDVPKINLIGLNIVEDTAKLMGIVGWTTACAVVVLTELRRDLPRAAAD